MDDYSFGMMKISEQLQAAQGSFIGKTRRHLHMMLYLRPLLRPPPPDPDEEELYPDEREEPEL